MADTKEIIIQAAGAVAKRQSFQKTTMGDIAKAACLSRQTIYSVMGCKENVIAEVICHNEMHRLQSIKRRLVECKSLSEQLDVYLDERVVIPFERINMEPNIFEIWANPEINGHPAIKKIEQADFQFLSEFFLPYADKLGEIGQSPAQFATFVIFICASLKVSPMTHEMLNAYLPTLKATILTMLVNTASDLTEDPPIMEGAVS
ncbi:TetR/AcrR family transcriptional regulator [Cohaesibacter celericrescens]|uniref:HTH tetR-type domain-containing protein n=1 Tax=Cohaesibacter celericrescens TaxID=2067669 RepID=A0A2N5XMF8_9HYPH|nr:TetR/AcrR family transcriptional regulator [Cohaesibacter celericrescens]PLW75716.1 hypothetical protein C0081_18940 [Cohaesibacter celericrescens]